MAESEAPFASDLRADYDTRLFDAEERRAKARILRTALEGAGLWPRPGARVLDVGAGAGILLASLGEGPGLRVGCDLRGELFRARPSAARQVLFAQADAARLPFREGVFDLVLCKQVLEEVPDWRAGIASMARSVAPGGVLYVTEAHASVLLSAYALAERAGRKIPASSLRFAEQARGMDRRNPERAYDIAELTGWRYVDVTPHLVRASHPLLRLVPAAVLGALCRHLSPSYGRAWCRPA